MSEVPTFVWAMLACLLATGIRALTELSLTRMKLKFARELLRNDDGHGDPDAVRKNLDAVRMFVTPSFFTLRRHTGHTRSLSD